MEIANEDSRREERLPVTAGATLTLRGWPLMVKATTLNMSATGALLRFTTSVDLQIGQVITCDFDVSDHHATELPDWAQGQVVRIEGNDVALRFLTASFIPQTGESPLELAS